DGGRRRPGTSTHQDGSERENKKSAGHDGHHTPAVTTRRASARSRRWYNADLFDDVRHARLAVTRGWMAPSVRGRNLPAGTWWTCSVRLKPAHASACKLCSCAPGTRLAHTRDGQSIFSIGGADDPTGIPGDRQVGHGRGQWRKAW